MDRKRVMQFGTGTLLLLTACVAGYFSAYRFGYEEIMSARARAISTRTYDVSDLLSDNDALAAQELVQIEQLIEGTTAGIWLAESHSMLPYPANRSLVIRQSGSGHSKIQKLLADLRSLSSLNE